MPFGAMVEYHPISDKDLSGLHQFGPEVLPGMFLGWKGDNMVADIEELEQMNASELHARRLNAKEVLTLMKNEKIVFPVADGTVKNLWRRSTSTNIHFNQKSSETRKETRNSSKKIKQTLFSISTSR